MPKADTSGKTPAENGGEVETLRPYERMRKQLEGIAKIDADNGSGFDIAANVVDKMLTVDETDIDALIDGILDAGKDGPLKAEDMEHKPFLVKEITWLKSSEAFSAGGFGVYAVVKAIGAIKMEELLFSVGAVNVVSALFAMDQKNVFDGDKSPTLVIRSRPVPNGKLFYLERA